MRPSAQHQRGGALAICLILLLVMTLLGIGYLRTASLGVQLTGNREQTQILQQAAENAVAAVVREANAGITASPSLLDRSAQYAVANPTGDESNAFRDFKRCLTEAGTPSLPAGITDETAAAADISCDTALGSRGVQAWVTVEWQGCAPVAGENLNADPNAPRLHFFKVTGTAQYPDASASAEVAQYVYLREPSLCPPALRQISRRS